MGFVGDSVKKRVVQPRINVNNIMTRNDSEGKLGKVRFLSIRNRRCNFV